MTESPAWQLQTALYDLLKNDAQLQTLIGNPPRVYDAVPDDAVFPLVQIGPGRLEPFAGTEGAMEHLLRITIFSRWGGRRECKIIADAVRNTVQDCRPPLTDHRVVHARLVFEDHLRHRDPETYQASMRFRVVTAPLEVVA